MRDFIVLLFLLVSILSTPVTGKSTTELPTSHRADEAIKKQTPILAKQLSKQDLSLGSSLFIRIFKQSAELEVWLENDNTKQFQLFKTYPICSFSGELGPKLREGDLQSPEGFYYVKGNQLNPWSRFHLSFNLGYPNHFDRAHGRTGNALMVHGNCVSIGCYAMTDSYIEEIYTLAYNALKQGQMYFRVHIFPFRMTPENMRAYQSSRWIGFWQNLQQGYLWFEQHKQPPNVEVVNKQYVFNNPRILVN